MVLSLFESSNIWFHVLSGIEILPFALLRLCLSLSPGISTFLNPFEGGHFLISSKISSAAFWILFLFLYLVVSIEIRSQFASVVDGPKRASPINSPINAKPYPFCAPDGRIAPPLK